MSGTGVNAEDIENRLWHLKRNGLLKNNSVQKITTAWAMGSENKAGGRPCGGHLARLLCGSKVGAIPLLEG